MKQSNAYLIIIVTVIFVGITFIVTGLMGMAFMSFMGIKYGKEDPKKTESAKIEKTNQK